jgi:hypothetical protein
VSGNDLYAGGGFTTAGGVAANYIAKWDGSNWSPLGSGMDAYGGVYALAISGSDLYAGGEFTTAGGSPATNIAKWNGNSWSPLGSGMNAYVYALVASGADLYAGGVFTTADGSPATSIAKWNGSTWSPLGSGMNGAVNALAVSRSDLYAGGQFMTAGGKFSAYLAKAIVYSPFLTIEPNGSGSYFIHFSGVPGSVYQLLRAPRVTGPWTINATQTAPQSGLVEFEDPFPPQGQAYYRTPQP